MNKPVFRLKYSLAGAVYETVGYSGPHFSVITVNDESGVKLTLIPSRPITLISASLEFWHEYEKNEKFFVNGYQSWTTSGEMSAEDIYRGTTPLAGVTKYTKDMAITSGDYAFTRYEPRPGFFHSLSHPSQKPRWKCSCPYGIIRACPWDGKSGLARVDYGQAGNSKLPI